MVAHLAEIAPHARPDIGIRRRRRGALELAILLRQLVRGRDEEIGMALGDDRLCALLVRGIAVGMQEQDGHRLYAATDRVGRRRPHRILIELDQHLPLRVHALAELVTQITLDQGLVAAKEQVVGFRPVDAADLVDIAKALRGEKRAGCPGALQNRVDRDGGAVEKKPRGAKLRSRFGHSMLDAGDEPRRRGQRFSEAKLPGRLVESGDVGKSPADVGRQPNLTQLHRAQELRAADRRKRRYQPRPCAATPAISSPSTTALLRSTGITSLAKRPIERRLSASVKSPKANWPTM